VTDPENNVTTYTWDTANRVVTIQDGRNIVYLTNHYDANGRVDHQTLADPNAAYNFAYTLDQAGTSVTRTDVTDPRNHTKRLTFNPHHDLIEQIDGFGAPEARTTTIARQTTPSVTNLVTAVTDPLLRRTEYTYDAFGHVRTVKQLANTPTPVTTTYTYEPSSFQLATVS
jgi:YD repeat-containing protein